MLHCTSISMSSKIVSQIFNILFQTGNINIFIPHGALFSIDIQQALFLPSIWDSQSLTWQSIKRKYHNWKKLEPCKVVHDAKLNRRADGDCSFNGRKGVKFLISFEIKLRTCSFGTKNKTSELNAQNQQ